jgi:hypothetical protein
VFLLVLISSVIGLLFLFLPRRRRAEQITGELPMSAAVSQNPDATSTLALSSDTDDPTEGAAPVTDPTTFLFLVALVVTVAALVFMYPRTSPSRDTRTRDDPSRD